MLALFLFARVRGLGRHRRNNSLAGSYLDAKLGENQANARAVEPFGFDLTLSAPPRTIGMGYSRKW
ncbi:MAG TPA: hypothetical protein VFV69_00210 [Steroidobacteraceae bacterium]|nr:hypothetical protein [Steroidobacteraceae bacterium]